MDARSYAADQAANQLRMKEDPPPTEPVYQYKGTEVKGLALGDVVNLAGCLYEVRKVLKRGRFILKYLGDDPDAHTFTGEENYE